jgi:DNA polymerase (family 10)
VLLDLSNADVGRRLRELALFLAMQDVPFKPQAYERAAIAVAAHPTPVARILAEKGEAGLCAVQGVGKGIAERIAELLRTGRIADLERARAEVPVDIVGLTSIPGVGPKAVRALHRALGVRTVSELAEAARAGRVRGVERFGDKSEQNLLRNIAGLERSPGRLPLGVVLPLAASIERRLAAIPGVARAMVAGSIRRRKETIGDVDVVVACDDDAARVMEVFTHLADVAWVEARGPTKSTVRLKLGIDADLRVVPEASFGAALAYFTGSKAHNVALRRRAIERELKLNEYGLYRGARAIAGRTEDEIYAALELELVAPELREDRGEVEAAAGGRLPRLVGYDELRGDLHVEALGEASLDELAAEAKRRGLESVALCSVFAAGHERELARSLDAARAASERTSGVTVLAGVDAGIRPDGSLDLSGEVAARLDVVGASLRSDGPRDETTVALVRALEDPNVDVLFCPPAAGGERASPAFELEPVLATARRLGKSLEVCGRPDRTGLRDEDARRALEAGVKLCVTSCARRPAELAFGTELGLAVARRAWARRGDVLTTEPLSNVRALFGRPRRRGR